MAETPTKKKKGFNLFKRKKKKVEVSASGEQVVTDEASVYTATDPNDGKAAPESARSNTAAATAAGATSGVSSPTSLSAINEGMKPTSQGSASPGAAAGASALKKKVTVQDPKEQAAKEKGVAAKSTTGATSEEPFQKSWLSQTKMFKRMSDWAFDLVDVDKSGEVDEKELYSGLLLIHLKLGTSLGPAACKPISRQRCEQVFKKMDHDKSGSLDKSEFQEVMMVLFGNVLFRVLFQWSMTLMIVPMIAQLVLENVIIDGSQFIWNWICNLDEHSTLANEIEVTIEDLRDSIISFILWKSPMWLQNLGSTIWGYICLVPEGVWKSLPLTLISTVLVLVIVPWSLMKIDDFFQAIADKKQKTPPLPPPQPDKSTAKTTTTTPDTKKKVSF